MNWFKSFWKPLTTPLPAGVHETVEVMNNFTPRAQETLALARKEACRFHHNFVGTEHLLLGLIRLGQGTAVSVLGKLGLDLETVGLEVEKQVGRGVDHELFGALPPFTPRVKKVLALAAKEARALNHTYVGTEHILLGLLAEGDGVAARVLKNLGVDIEQTRQEVLKELDPNFSRIVEGPKTSETPQSANLPQPERDLVDTSKRYDVYCIERNQEVVYRNALFKGTKKLFPKSQYDSLSELLELEQADGQIVLIARSSVMKLCEHGVRPNPERTAGESSPG